MNVKLDQISGIGPKTLYHLRNQGIWSTYDLVLHVPKAYEDFSFTHQSMLKHKEIITIKGTISSEIKLNRYTKGQMISFKLDFNEQKISVVAFGKGYLIKTFKTGDEVVVKGYYDLYQKRVNASAVLAPEKKTEIKPIYKIEGIHDGSLSKIILEIFNENKVQLYENIPKIYTDKYRLISRQDAYYNLHFPHTLEHIRQAHRRLKFEEAFYLQLKLKSNRKTEQMRNPKAYDINQVKALIETLPYELTSDQKKAVNDLYRDFKNPYASFRLIQGDVGSGKTVVALLAIYACITAKEQVALMAPTDMLANQHYQYFKLILKDVNIALLTGKTKDKESLNEKIKSHQIDLVIGTHALIEDYITFDHLGLVVIDEQHKFGVSTRNELVAKAKDKDLIYLTATPIPRTLSMLYYGDANVSIIKQKPANRKVVETIYLTKDKLNDLFEAMHQALKRKEHIYVVVPAISSTKVDDNIETVYQELLERFDEPIYIMHGKLSKTEQQQTMEDFTYHPGSILLSTTMIEVGIDIPTATLIAIFSAEHFGLSQLHQLRGRVGRSNLHSTCFLISSKEDIERLEILSKESDGFILSEYDLVARGPGNLIGEEQSGFIKFKFLDLLEDEPILLEAKKCVDELSKRKDLSTNPQYKYISKYLIEEKNVL